MDSVREEGDLMLLANQMVITVTGNTFAFNSGDRLPEAKGNSPVIQIVADWDQIDARFDSITIGGFKPVPPTNKASETLKRKGKFIATFVFNKVTDPTGYKFTIEFNGHETVVIDPGMVLKP